MKEQKAGRRAGPSVGLVRSQRVAATVLPVCSPLQAAVCAPVDEAVVSSIDLFAFSGEAPSRNNETGMLS